MVLEGQIGSRIPGIVALVTAAFVQGWVGQAGCIQSHPLSVQPKAARDGAQGLPLGLGKAAVRSSLPAPEFCWYICLQ